MNERVSAKDLYSLEDHLGPEDQLNLLRLLRASDRRLFLIVEGPSDVTALRRAINRDECDVVPAGSKQGVIDSVAAFVLEDSDIIGLVDRDFDFNIEASIPDSIAATALYDREMDSLIIGGLLSDYTRMYVDESLMASHINSTSTADLLDRLMAAAWVVGVLRWLSVTGSLGLGMYKIALTELVGSDITIDTVGLVQRAIARGARASVDEYGVATALQNEFARSVDYAYCCGHDLVQIVALSGPSWSRQKSRIADVENFVNENFSAEVRKRMPWAAKLEILANDRGRQLWRDT